jgi:hypothetical protein
MVLIDSYVQTSTGRRVPGGGVSAGRSLLAGSVDVITRIVSEDSASATDMLGKLTIENINNNLALQGVPGGEMRAEPTLQASEEASISWPFVAAALGGMALIVVTSTVAWARWRTTSRRLAGALKGTEANQRDLAPSLRSKYRALRVLGSGGNGVVVEVSQITRGKKWSGAKASVSAWRAVKLVHATRRKLDVQEVRTLEREVRVGTTLNWSGREVQMSPGLDLCGLWCWKALSFAC